jgi:hypothetical protein
VDSVSQTNHIWWRNIDYLGEKFPKTSKNYFFDIENCVLLKKFDFLEIWVDRRLWESSPRASEYSRLASPKANYAKSAKQAFRFCENVCIIGRVKLWSTARAGAALICCIRVQLLYLMTRSVPFTELCGATSVLVINKTNLSDHIRITARFTTLFFNYHVFHFFNANFHKIFLWDYAVDHCFSSSRT